MNYFVFVIINVLTIKVTREITGRSPAVNHSASSFKLLCYKNHQGLVGHKDSILHQMSGIKTQNQWKGAQELCYLQIPWMILALHVYLFSCSRSLPSEHWKPCQAYKSLQELSTMVVSRVRFSSFTQNVLVTLSIGVFREICKILMYSLG